MTNIVQANQGFARQHPDGLEAIFGAPIVNERHAEQAVQAAYAMLQYLMQSRQELNFQVHMGMSQGTVIVNQRSGRRGAGPTILGDLLQRIKRIASQTPTDKIWVTEAVQQQTHRLVNYQPVVAPQLWFRCGPSLSPGGALPTGRAVSLAAMPRCGRCSVFP